MDPRLNSLVVAQQLQARIDYANSARTASDSTQTQPYAPSRRSLFAWLPRRAHA
jgi:hypothetical protein